MVGIWLSASCGFAALVGVFTSYGVMTYLAAGSLRQSALDSMGSKGLSVLHVPEVEGLSRRVIVAVERESRRRGGAEVSEEEVATRAARRRVDRIRLAGLVGQVNSAGIARTRMYLALLCGAAGALVGLLFSTELAILLALVGTVTGWTAVVRAFESERKVRTAHLERDLAEMLEVMALGLRSGLSFDRAFGLYPQYFDTGLGRACEAASARWNAGFLSKEETLQELSEGYDSSLLDRVVAAMIRSLRFGDGLADTLERCAAEARETGETRMRERIAKAPVKMMLPVGTMILPAMLLLVMGPVLLELAQGF